MKFKFVLNAFQRRAKSTNRPMYVCVRHANRVVESEISTEIKRSEERRG